MAKRFLIAVLLMAASFGTRAQVADVAGGYSFMDKCPALSLQAYADDPFGSTYSRADFAFKADPLSLCSSYLEVARTLNFWKGTQFEPLGLHVEFNGFMNMDNCNWLFGLDYTLPLKSLVKLSLLYKTFNGGATSIVPLQLSILWDSRDIFGVRGLEFRGRFKVWGETTSYWFGDENPLEHAPAQFIISALPQLWYSVGQFIGWDGLSIGGELDMSYNYVGCSGFRARPFAGLRFSF